MTDEASTLQALRALRLAGLHEEASAEPITF